MDCKEFAAKVAEMMTAQDLHERYSIKLHDYNPIHAGKLARRRDQLESEVIDGIYKILYPSASYFND